VQLSHWVMPVTKLLWAGPALAHPNWLGRVQPIPKIKRRRIWWAKFGPTVLGRYWPLLFWTELGPAIGAGPVHICCNIVIIYYILLLYLKKQKIQKHFKGHFKIFVIFSNVFLPILLNIGLYTYIVRYKSGIKIPGFLRNISKKNSKHFQKKISNFF
jgi:hypothetical protein